MAEKEGQEKVKIREENLYTIGDNVVTIGEFATNVFRQEKCPDCINKVKCQITKEQRADCLQKLKIYLMTQLVGYNYDEL